jgi:micrococcal nuclease
MYEYKVKEIINIYDGDTITVRLDLGFGVTKIEKLRLGYINAPEMKGEEHASGLLTRDWLRARLEEAISNNALVTVKTFKDLKEKYGRYLAVIFIDGISINEEMLQEGLASKY